MIIIESDIFGDGHWGKLSSLPEINALRAETGRKRIDRDKALLLAEREIARWRGVILDAYPHIRMRVADTDVRLAAAMRDSSAEASAKAEAA